MTEFPLPAAMLKRAKEFTGPPAPVRRAATVALLRPAPAGFEVYVLRRASSMVFGGVHAFPGGGVDPDDRPRTVRDDWGVRLGLPDEQARAVVGAAVRELFEEAGVLLAGDAPVHDVGGTTWEAARAAVQRRERKMTDLLAEHGLRLRDDLLHPWGRWVTPEFEPRRFDTWFFVARLPEGQEARDVSGESDGTAWIRPAATDGLSMLPPTRVTLDALSAYPEIDDVFGAEREAAVPVRPRIELTGDGGGVLTVEDQPKRPVM